MKWLITLFALSFCACGNPTPVDFSGLYLLEDNSVTISCPASANNPVYQSWTESEPSGAATYTFRDVGNNQLLETLVGSTCAWHWDIDAGNEAQMIGGESCSAYGTDRYGNRVAVTAMDRNHMTLDNKTIHMNTVGTIVVYDAGITYVCTFSGYSNMQRINY